jgi:NarL family two-component system response regulator LiaR
MVDSEPGLAWAGEATSGKEAVRLIPALAPDVVLIDLVMPAMDGVSAILSLRPLLPNTRFVAISCSLDASLARAALDAGVTGYVMKTTNSHDLAAVIRAAHEGRRVVDSEITAALDASERETTIGADLTRRERSLLALMACGLPNQDISVRMNIGLPTVKFHVTNILSKLQVDNRTAAVLTALRHGIVELDQ